jgi:parvulin-like peptidyl-prolyl isomerase
MTREMDRRLVSETASNVAPRSAPRRRARIRGLALAALVTLAALAAFAQSGCSLIGGQVVAKVGDRTLTLKEYQVMLRTAAGGPAPPDSVRRKMMVDDWVERQLLFLEAQSQRLDTTAAIAATLKDQMDQMTVEEIYRREVTSKVKVTDAMLRQLYDRRKETRVLARILVATKSEADSLKVLIDSGQLPFEKAAFMKSLDRASAANGGLAGEASPGDLPSEIEDAVWGVKVGGVTHSVRSQGGYDLIKVVEAKKNPQRPFEEEKTQLEGALKNRMMYDATIGLLDGLKKQRNFLIVDEDVLRLAQTMAAAKQVADTIPAFTASQKAEPLARYTGGPYTVGDFLKEVRSASGQGRPDLTDQRQVRQFVENHAGLHILADEAAKRGLAKDPRVVKNFERRRDNLMAQMLVGRILGSPKEATEEELRQEFEAHKSEFVNQGSASVFRLATSDAHQADEAAREARANVDFASLQRRYARPTAEELKQGPEVQVFFDASNTALADSLRAHGPDGVVGPVAQGGRYFVYKIRGVYPPLNSTFEDAKGTLAQRVRLIVENRKLREHIEQLKKRWPPSVNDKVVQSATPAPPAKPGEEDAS